MGPSTACTTREQRGDIPAFDNVVIETSGLAEPGPVLQAFLSEPTLDGLYRVASVLTLVDAVNWAGTSEAHDESVRQVALADQIRITKLDMVTGDRQNCSSRIRLELRRINPSAGDRRGRLVGGGNRTNFFHLAASTRQTPNRIPARGSMFRRIRTPAHDHDAMMATITITITTRPLAQLSSRRQGN